MVEIVGIVKFIDPINVCPGDTLRVLHTLTDSTGKLVSESKCSQDITETGVWTHSILFKLNGKLNHIIGDQYTINWLESQ